MKETQQPLPFPEVFDEPLPIKETEPRSSIGQIQQRTFMRKSQIRNSEIAALLDKVQKQNYGKYLKSVHLKKVRGFSGGDITFDFPVTALIGPNGGGKSTILGAAACAYKAIKPGLFFPKSSIGDDSMQEWSIEFEIIDKSLSPKSPIRRSSTFRQLKWVRGDVITRPVSYFGINRTVPAGEKPSFKKLMKPSYKHNGKYTPLNSNAATEVQKILGKNVDAFKETQISGRDLFYIGQNIGNEYSEFHFGAGESSIIRIVSAIEASEENALILIEEIENGLHPVATRRLVEYLIDAARRLGVQTVFTTHSDEALGPLPTEAIWASIDGNAQQGKLSVGTLRAIVGRIETRLAIFTEDEFARHWIEAIIRYQIPENYEQIEVHSVAGDGNAVKIHLGHRDNPSINFSSLCILDGDSLQVDNESKGVLRLPGEQPERTVFDDEASRLDTDVALLTVACQLPPGDQEKVRTVVDNVSLTNRDGHILFNQLGIELGFVPEVVIRGAFLSRWIQHNQSEITHIISAIRAALEVSERR